MLYGGSQNWRVRGRRQKASQLWCDNLALTVDIFLLLGGEDFREILSTLAVRRCGQKDSTQQLIRSKTVF